MDRTSLSCFILAVASIGCSNNIRMDAGTDAGTDIFVDTRIEPTWGNVQMVFNRSCAVGTTSCHSDQADPPANLNLSMGNAYTYLVNIPSGELPQIKRVDPGHPERSWIIVKLEDTMSMYPECATPELCGTRMPMVAGDPLPANEIQLIKDWIRLGAPR